MGKRFDLDAPGKEHAAPSRTASLDLKRGGTSSKTRNDEHRRFDLESGGTGASDQPMLFSRKATATILVCLSLFGLLLVTLGLMTGYKLGNQQRQRAVEVLAALQGAPSAQVAEGAGENGQNAAAPDAGATQPAMGDQGQAGAANATPNTSEADGQVDWSGFTGDMVETPEQAAAPETYPLTVYTVQVGAFSVAANAGDAEQRLVAKGYPAFTHVDEGGSRTMHYVRFGEYQTREEAEAAAADFEAAEGTMAIVMVGESRRRVEDPVANTAFSVQVGSFPDAESAELHARDLASRGLSPCVIRMFGSDGRTWFDVQLAQFATREQAEAFALEFRDREGIPSNVRALDAGLLEERKTCLQ